MDEAAVGQRTLALLATELVLLSSSCMEQVGE
jgi:hypothetical protein